MFFLIENAFDQLIKFYLQNLGDKLQIKQYFVCRNIL